MVCALWPALLQVMLHVTFKRHMSAIEQGLGAEATQLLQQVIYLVMYPVQGLYC
jgi:hypothetical protein